VILVGLIKHGLGFFKLFVPSGLPLPMYILITPIEIISFLARPITLSVRLFANMLAGHVMLKIFGAFVVALGGLAGAAKIAAILPLGAAFAITGLEFLVAFLQAYVFAILTVIYLNDVEHMHH
jgi:F-type H+-transporting ATPase subunit a